MPDVAVTRNRVSTLVAAAAAALLAVVGIIVSSPAAQADPGLTGVVQGTVYDPSAHAVLAGEVTVTAYQYDDASGFSVPSPQETTVDANGHWQFDGLPVGEYAFHFESMVPVKGWADGFASGEYDINEVRANHSFDPIGQDETRTVDYTLLEANSISGRLTDASGHGIFQSSVLLYRYQTDDDGNVAMETFGATSYEPDADGYFQIPKWLPAGEYTLRFVKPPSSTQYESEFWNDKFVGDADDADWIDLTEGDAFEANAELGLPRTVGGTVKNTSGTVLAGTQVTAYRYDADADYWNPAADAVTTASGKYTLSVSPGVYRIGFERPGYLERFYTSATTVESAKSITVGATAVTGVNATLLRSSSITGKITLAPSKPVKHPGAGDIEIIACPTTEPCSRDFGGFEADYNAATGAYKVAGLAPGKYHLLVSYLGQGNFRDEYYSNARDEAHATAITVRSQATTSANVMLDAGATIAGTLTQGIAPVADFPVGAYEIVNGHVLDGRALRQATTDSMGRFKIGGLPSGSYVVKAVTEQTPELSAPWYGGTFDPDRATRVKVTVPGNVTGIPLTLEDSATIHGIITGNDSGDPLPDVSVNVYRFDTPGGTAAKLPGDFSYAFTDEDGGYSIQVPRGEYVVTADADATHVRGGYGVAPGAEAPPAGTRITVSAGGDADASFGLDLGGSYTGRIVGSDGQPVSDVSVGIDEEAYAFTESDGTFRLDGLSPGTHELVIEAYDSAYASQVRFAAPATALNAAPIALGDIPIADGSTITGVVRGATGAVLKNVPVSAYVALPGGTLSLLNSTISAVDGTFELGGLPAGPIYLGFDAPGGVYDEQFLGGSPVWSLSDTVTFATPGETRHVDARLSSGNAITGVLKSKSTGKPVPNAHVQVVRYGNDFRVEFVGGATTNAKGAYVISGLEAGSYTFEVNQDGAVGYTPIEEGLTVPDAGMMTVSRYLIPQSRVSGVIKIGSRPADGVTVTARDAVGHVVETTTSSTGAYSFRLDRGTWTVIASDPEYRAMPAYWRSGVSGGSSSITGASRITVTGTGAAYTARNVTLTAGGGEMTANVFGPGEPDPSGSISISRHEFNNCSNSLTRQTFTTRPGQSLNDLFPLKNVRPGYYCMSIDAYSASTWGGGRYETQYLQEIVVTAGGIADLGDVDLGQPEYLRHEDPTLTPGGEPVIHTDGSPQVWEDIYVTAGPWTHDARFYPVQWTRNGKPIAGANSSSYVLTPGDAGAQIGVRVGATDYEDDWVYDMPYEATLGLDVAKAPAATPWSDASISGVYAAGQKLTADPGSWDLTGLTFRYQWLRDGAPISGATAKTYTLTAADVGGHISLSVTATRAGFESTTVGTDGSDVIPAIALKATVAPTASVVGTDFVATPGIWTPAGATITFEWREYADGTGTVIGTGPTLPVSAAGAGDTRVDVIVTAAETGYATTHVTRTARFAVAPVFTTPPVLSTADPVLGQPVSVDLSGAASTPELAGGTVTYQWFRGATSIVGATKDSYVPLPVDVGATLTVKITLTSAGTQPPAGPQVALTTSAVASADLVNLAPPALTSPTGDFLVGRRATSDTGSWSFTPTSFTYQWYRDGKAISKATSSTYLMTTADDQTELTVRVTAKLGTSSATATSDPVPVFVDSSPHLLVPPALPTEAHVGEKLTVIPGVNDITPKRTVYRWFAGGSAREETGPTYTPVAADLGDEIMVEVTYDGVTYYTDRVTVEAGAAPVASAVPTLTPSTTAGDGHTINATPGIWPSSSLSVHYRWQSATSADGPWTDLPGRTAPHLTFDVTGDPTAFVDGHYYRVVVTASRSGYLSGQSASAAVRLAVGP